MALATLTVDLIMRAGGFESDMKRAEKIADKSMKAIAKGARQMGAAMAVALAAGATAVAVATKDAIDRMDDISKAAKTVGMSTEGFSRLSYAAQLANVSQEELQAGLGRLLKSQRAAMEEGSAQADAFKALGIAVKDANGYMRPTRDVMLDFADAFKRLKGSPEALAAALDIFGRGFQTFVPLINDGAEGIRKLEKESDRLGITISNKTGEAAEEFNDNLERIKFVSVGLASTIAADLLPDMIRLTDEWIEASQEGGTLANTAHNVASAVRFVASAAFAAVDGVQALTSEMIGLIKVYQSFAALTPGYTLLQKFGDFDDAAQAARGGVEAFDTRNREIAEMFGRFGKPQTKIIWDAPASEVPSAGGGNTDALDEYIKRLEEMEEAEKKARGSSKASTSARRDAAAAAREQAEREEQLREAIRKTIEAHDEFRVQLEDLAAARGGEMAQAALQFKRDMEELGKLAAEGEVSAEDLATAEKLLAEQYRETTAAIEERLNPGRQVLDDLRFQIELTEMATQAERDRAIFLRDNINATADMAQEYADLNKVLDEQREKIEIADQFRSHWEDAFASIFDGTKSVKEAFSDLASAIIADIARIAAQKLVEQLFGGYGTEGGGLASLGSFFENAKGNVFDHGMPVTAFAKGGIVSRPTIFPMARGMGLMAEAGPEAVMPLTRDNQGRLGVRAQGGGVVQNIYVEGRPDERTAYQIQQRAAERQTRASARNR